MQLQQSDKFFCENVDLSANISYLGGGGREVGASWREWKESVNDGDSCISD